MAGEALLPVDAGAAFLVVLAVHIAAGLTCVACAAGAALSRKGGPRHVRFGRTYVASLAVVSATRLVLASMRWPYDNHLVVLGVASAATACTGLSVARRAVPVLRVHGWAMASSVVLLLTAFHVDNGPNLPLWRLLPYWAFWVLPALVGIPLTAAAIHRARLAAAQRPSGTPSTARPLGGQR